MARSHPPLGLHQDRPVPRLHDRIVQVMRARHYSPRTQKAYLYRMGRFLAFHGGRHPRTMSEEHLNAFLSDLATTHSVAASTQDQALAAVLFVYEHVLVQPLDRIDGVVRSRKPRRLPVVLTRAEVVAVLAEMEGASAIVAQVLYGSGLRLMEALTLRVKDVDLQRREIRVRDGKGARDRVTMLPEQAVPTLAGQLWFVRVQHEEDLRRAEGGGHLDLVLGCNETG